MGSSSVLIDALVAFSTPCPRPLVDRVKVGEWPFDCGID
jgi:hypothetical protein